MADDWLVSAVDGLSMDNGLELTGGGGGGGGGGTDSPSLSSNISQLLKSTRRDRADLEARLTQLRGFIQQTDDVMRGILESGDPALAAKYSHLAGTRRSLEQNATHLQELLHKVAESEARARQLAERGRQLEAEEAAGETEAAAGAAAAAAVGAERPDHEQKVAVVRGRPGPGAARKRDAADAANDSLRAAVLHNWASLERTGAGPSAPRTRTFSQDEPEETDADSSAAAPMDRLLRALRGEPARAAPPPPPPPPPASALLGAEAALRDKAVELDATRQKLHQLRQLMAAVQDARQSGAPAVDAPAELRALLGDVEAALDGEEDEPERGEPRGCDDCGLRSSGPHSLPPAGLPRPLGRVSRGTPAREPAPLMAASPRRSQVREVAPPPRPASAERPTRAASLEPAFLMSRPAPPEPSPAAEQEVRAQLQHMTALVQSMTRPPWPPQHAWPGVYPVTAAGPAPAGPGQYPIAGWPYPHPPPPPPAAAEMQHQQTLSALGQCFQLLHSQQQQILEMQRQVQTTAAAVASSQPPTPAPPPPPPPPPPQQQFLAPALLRVDEPPTLELADGFGPQSGSMLNNQVAPGSRANNYWDNFRSYSRQNLLSGGSEPEGERPRGDSESQDEPRAEGFMARPRAKKQKVNKENQQLDRAASNTRAAAPEPTRPRVHRSSTPQNNPQVDAIYSCVTALIAQNQEQPEFLIELLHDLQLVRTERQRQQVLLAVQSVVVQEMSGARHKQRNRAAPAAAAGGAAAPPAVAQHLLAAEREEIKSHSHLVNKHTKNLSQSLRPETTEAGGGLSDLEDTTAKNLAPHKNAATKNTAKQKTFEPPGGALGALPLDDPELQLARLLHEMNVFLSDHHAALLSPVLLARLERLLLRALCQGRTPPPAGLNQQLEQAMVPFMGQPVAESGGRLVQAVLERLGAALRSRELPASPPAAEPPSALGTHGLDSESEDEERPPEPLEKRHDRQGQEAAHTGEQLCGDDGPQTIPEQEVPCLNGRDDPAERRTGELADPTATYRPLGTPRDTPEPAAGHECLDTAETDG